jgi:hypothetical protein
VAPILPALTDDARIDKEGQCHYVHCAWCVCWLR